jgi:hypothetical protein
MERRVGGRDMGSGGSRKFGERGLVDEDAEWMGAGCKKIKKLSVNILIASSFLRCKGCIVDKDVFIRSAIFSN